MTCAELDQRAVDYLYGELGAADRAAVDAHLATCEACQREVRALERTLGVTREALRGPLAHEAPSRVRVALQQEAARAVAQAAARQARSGWSLGEWLRRPWFLPLVASFGVVALFFLAKPAILDKPKQALEAEQAARKEDPGRDEESAEAPTAPGVVPSAEPVMTPPPAGSRCWRQCRLGKMRGGPASASSRRRRGRGPGWGSGRAAGDGPHAQDAFPAAEGTGQARAPVPPRGHPRWPARAPRAGPPRRRPPRLPPRPSPMVAAKSAAKPKDQVLDDDRVARGAVAAAGAPDNTRPRRPVASARSGPRQVGESALASPGARPGPRGGGASRDRRPGQQGGGRRQGERLRRRRRAAPARAAAAGRPGLPAIPMGAGDAGLPGAAAPVRGPCRRAALAPPSGNQYPGRGAVM